MSGRRKAASKEVDLEELVESGASGAYEALQLFRSRAIRLKSKNDNEAAISTLAKGAKSLLKHGYENAGAELGLLLIEFLNEVGGELTSSQVDNVLDVESTYPDSSTHRIEYLKAAIKWSIKAGTVELGDLKLHIALGKVLWTPEQRNAIYHFAAGEAPIQLNNLIQTTYKTTDNQVLKERALTVGILTFLSLDNLRDANELLSCYSMHAIDQDNGTYVNETELEKFNRFLLLTCQRDAQPLFKTLVNTYASALDFDDTVPTLLTGPIGLKFFNIQPKSQVNPMMNMLQQMLSK